METGRGVVSCASCRRRKLRCDREDPCSNCVARKFDCAYPSDARGRVIVHQRGDNNRLEHRLRRLEQLIHTITTARADPTVPAPTPTPAPTSGQELGNNGLGGLSASAESAIKPGRILAQPTGTTYVSASHWTAICNEVAEMKEHLDRTSLEDHGVPSIDLHKGPMLLEGFRVSSNLQDFLPDIPSQSVANKIVSQYFNSNASLIAFLHPPTFQDEYRRFWLDPSEASMSWVSLLFGMLAVGTFLCTGSGEALPEELGNLPDAVETFLRRSSECLVLSNYFSAPGQYTLEALIMNMQAEFIRRRDGHSQMGVWALAGTVIRIAFRMGYHRDPAGGYGSQQQQQQHQQFTPFEAEMRRRIWACIDQLDANISVQLSLPPMIEEAYCDTAVPRNLLDDEFGPQTEFPLPPSRPETELTPVLYTIAKGRITSVLRAIFTSVVLGRTDAYDEVLALDRRLRAAHAATPPSLRFASVEDSVTATPYLLTRRYNIELVYQKARCILHRYHMARVTPGGDDENENVRRCRYRYSRASCVEAAMAIMGHQTRIAHEVRPGGLLAGRKRLLTSLEMNDFMLAAMVVCLELSFRAKQPGEPEVARQQTSSVSSVAGEDDDGPVVVKVFSTGDLVGAIRAGHSHLEDLHEGSVECRQVSKLLRVMLQKSGNAVEGSSPTAEGTACATSGPLTSNLVSPYAQTTPACIAPTAVDDVDMLFENDKIANWDMWETFVQNSIIDDDHGDIFEGF